MIASGELTERISIYRPQRTAENVIPHSNFLQLLRTCWAKVRRPDMSCFCPARAAELQEVAVRKHILRRPLRAGD